MKKDVQQTFFKAFQFGGVFDRCIDVIRERYDLGYQPKNGEALDEKWQNVYDVVLPDLIKKDTALFDEGVIMYLDSPLMEEIEENIETCKSDAERERYLFSLLKPFKGYSDIFHPTAEIERLKLNVENCKADIKIWEQSQAKDEARGQIEACNWFIEERTKDIERIYHINRRFFEMVSCQINEKDSVEWCLEVFCSAAHKFADRLDALLLTYGIDLMKLQKESGIYLKEYRLITDLDFYIGSMELAQKYIDALKKNEPELSEPEQTAATQPGPKPQPQNRKYIANEYALAYIFDLYANGQQIPLNEAEGILDAKKIKEKGAQLGFEKPDTFYRAVRAVLVFDLNNRKHLESISKDWMEAVKALSENWTVVYEYLEKKKIDQGMIGKNP